CSSSFSVSVARHHKCDLASDKTRRRPSQQLLCRPTNDRLTGLCEVPCKRNETVSEHGVNLLQVGSKAARRFEQDQRAIVSAHLGQQPASSPFLPGKSPQEDEGLAG